MPSWARYENREEVLVKRRALACPRTESIARRLAVLALVASVGWLSPIGLDPTAQAAPLEQNFQCNEAGQPGPGRFACWNWSSPTGEAGPGGTVNWVHTCGPNGIVVYWWYHYEGAPFQIDGHFFESGREIINVSATNAGSTPGSFWLTGRCRSV